MLEYEVHSKAGLIAAVEAATQPTYAQARDNPVSIKCGSTHYNFPAGIGEQRAKTLINKIKHTTAKAFDIK